MDIKEFAEMFIKAEESAIQQGNFEPLEQIESPDIIIHVPPAPDFNGFEAHKQYLRTALETTEDLRQEWDYVTGDGNIAVVSLKEEATLTADNPVLQKSAGTTMKFDVFFILQRENDRVTEIWIKGSTTFE